jgi:L-ascorbate metabolism protein UlaG (beta-lactamase superfamily)
MLQGIHWLGHASVRIDDAITIYIDPWKVAEPKRADLILVTHEHFDHLSEDDIAKLSGRKTIVVASRGAAANLSCEVRAVVPGERFEAAGVWIETVPAYNTDKPNHPQSAGHVGYVVELAGRRIYHAGDTDLISEMKDIRCDVAILPVGGTYTMNATEAAQALEVMQPQFAIPIHWGEVVGSEKDARRFQSLAPEGVQVEILERE